MKSFNLSKHGLQTKDEILYLGTNSDLFLNSNKTYSDLQKLVMIGNDLVRKGIHDYLKVAQNFSHLEFHIVGSGNEKIDIDQLIKASKLQNVIFHGLIDQDLMVELLKDVQLHILPSRSEGFPKVILETACAAIPSIVYNDYGADQWISHNQNGYVVYSLEQVIELVDELHKNPNKLISVSNAAIELGQSFDWKNRIQKWEDVFLNS
jgi:glycosyltransferase involved in cell wall biosynthesis